MCPVYKLTNYVKPILSVYNVSNTGYYFYNVLWHSTGNKVNTMQCMLLSDNDINWSDIQELIKLGKQSVHLNKATWCFHP